MGGVEKITERILQDAKAECDAMLAQAKDDVSAIKAKYNAEADKVLRTAQEAVQKEAAAVLESGRSGAAMWRRNTLLEAKSKMVDEAYEKAIGFLSRMEEGAYFNLLFGMLKKAVDESKQADKALLADEQSEYVKPEFFRLSFNQRDMQKYAERLMDAFSKTDKEVKLELAKAPVEIAGGLMIQYGDVYIDCSIEESVRSVRSGTEPQVYAVLFGAH